MAAELGSLSLPPPIICTYLHVNLMLPFTRRQIASQSSAHPLPLETGKQCRQQIFLQIYSLGNTITDYFEGEDGWRMIRLLTVIRFNVAHLVLGPHTVASRVNGTRFRLPAILVVLSFH